MEPPPPLFKYNAHTSKKRVFSGGSSSFMDPDVIEISPPPSRSSKQLKKKEVCAYEIIDLDDDEDAEVIVIGEKFGTSDKGKGLKSYYENHSSHQEKVHLDSYYSDPSNMDSVVPVDGAESSSKSGSHKSVNLDFHSSDATNGAMPGDFFLHDVTDVDDLAILQAHFDSMDFPTGVEAPISLFLDSAQNSKKLNEYFSDMTDPVLFNSKSTAMTSSNPGAVPTPSWPQPVGIQGKAAVLKPVAQKLSTGIVPPNYVPFAGDAISNLNPAASSSSSYVGAMNQTDAGEFSFVPPQWFPNTDFTDLFSGLPVGPPHMFVNEGPHGPVSLDSFSSSDNYTSSGSTATTSDSTPNSMKGRDLDDVLRNYELFKRFDVVQDYVGHHYADKNSSGNQPPKAWAKKIQDEWKSLEKDLPDMIFVRVYESRMDLLRAVIIGAEGTPYHDGLFFFDVFFPCGYPNEPPKVYYHSGGLRLNPNLYHNGKVCLSLLNTWHGDGSEKWIPGKSTMLQVLVSIQGLILNSEPYFNEPGYASSYGTAKGKAQSQKYNENTFLLSLRTMCYTIRNPPKHFEDFALGHFYKRAHDILTACKEYSDGALVGSLVNGRAPCADAGNKSGSPGFRKQLPQYISMLAKDFTGIGVKDCEKFLSPAKEQKERKYSRGSRTSSVGIKLGEGSTKPFSGKLALVSQKAKSDA